MPADCVLAIDNMTLVRPALCIDRITSLNPAKVRAVCDALALTTAC